MLTQDILRTSNFVVIPCVKLKRSLKVLLICWWVLYIEKYTSTLSYLRKFYFMHTDFGVQASGEEHRYRLRT